MSSEYHSSILMSSAGNLRSIILETNSFRNANGGYPMELNERPHNISHGTNGRVPQRLYEIYTDPVDDLVMDDKVAKLELEKAKLIQMNRLILGESEAWRQKFEGLRQQQAVRVTTSNANNNAGEAMAFGGTNMDARMANLERQISLLVNARAIETGHIQALVNAVNKLSVNSEEMRIKLNRVEDIVSTRSWIEYRDELGGLDSQERISGASLLERGDYIPLRIESNMRNGQTGSSSGCSAGSPMRRSNGSRNTSQSDVSVGVNDMHPSSNGTSVIVSGGVENNPVSANFFERRQSDSTTITTIESGYCDDREDVFESGESGDVGLTDHQQQEGVSNGVPASGIIRCDDDIEFVAEVITPKSQRLSQNLHQPSVSETTRKEYGSSEHQRRASVFSQGFGARARPTALFDDFEDPDPDAETSATVNNRPSQPSIEPEIGRNLNNIFNNARVASQESMETIEESSGDSTTPAAIKRKRVSIVSSEQKRIRGIAKAPIKREPGTLSIFSVRGSGASSNHSESPITICDTPPPPPPPQQDRIMETLRNMKKERVAHAIDGYHPGENIWRCICGHQTTTKNGMKLHVKNMGTVEARYMCPWNDCTGRFLFPFLVRNHLVKDHKDNTVPDKLYGCEKCYQVFYDKNNLRTHLNDRNEICKSTPRRRSYPCRLRSVSDVPAPRSHPEPRTPLVLNPANNQETAKRPSIIITL